MTIIYIHASLALLAVPLGLFIFLNKKGTVIHKARYVLTDSSFNTIYDREFDLLCLEHKKISEDEN